MKKTKTSEAFKKTSFRKIILDFPEQLRAGLRAAKNIRIKSRFGNIVVCGMGGSAWPAEILKSWLSLPTPIFINKTYDLPPQTNKKSLIIISSYSGNTEEPLSCYQQAKKEGLKIIGLTTNGKLEQLCRKDKIPLVLIPKDVPQPRMGCGYTFAALAGILINHGLIKDRSQEIASTAKSLRPARKEPQGKELAQEIQNRIPIVYTSDRLKALAYIWKIKFDETGKTLSFSNYFPELNHNELNGYALASNNFFVIILKDENEHPRILKRMNLTAKIINSKNIPVKIIGLRGKNLLEKIFNSIILADWTSYYLAVKKGIDPFSVKMVEEFKKKMK